MKIKIIFRLTTDNQLRSLNVFKNIIYMNGKILFKIQFARNTITREKTNLHTDLNNFNFKYYHLNKLILLFTEFFII